MFDTAKERYKSRISFRLLLFLAFVLEASGYLVVPYLALHLRETYAISEMKIGIYLMIGIWLRPVWALSATSLSKRISTSRLIQIGAFVSGIAISGLAFSHNSIIAFFAVIFVNLGFSLWNPSVYAFIYDLFGNGENTKKRVSQLNMATYVGAAMGSGVASILATTQRDLIFLVAACSFLSAFVFAAGLVRQSVQTTKQDSIEKKNVKEFSWRHLASFEIAILSIASIGFWASYAQFNSFFSLFVTDQLKQPQIIGVSFSFMTIAVAGLSLVISKSARLQKYDLRILVGILFVVGPLWFAMVTVPSLWITWTFLFALALSEAFFVLVLAHLWARQATDKTHLMQSLNFALCNVGMGGGALAGGLFYKTDGSVPLFGFGLENLTLCWTVAFTLVGMIFLIRNKNIRNKTANIEEFRFGRHSSSELLIFSFEKPALSGDSVLSNQIVSHCEWVQDQIWTKKFQTSHNSIGQDVVLLAWDEKRNEPGAFLSATFFESRNGLLYVYTSDAMILPYYRGKGLLNYFFKSVNEIGAKKFPKANLVNIIASGYIHIFTTLEKSPLFRRLDWPCEKTIQNELPQILKSEFEEATMDGHGVVKCGWLSQNNGMTDVWPDGLADRYKFPRGVDYFSGDVLVRLYSYTPSEDKEIIQ